MTERHVLVTGGAGFIGVNLVYRILQNYDFGVVNLDKLNLCREYGVSSRTYY